MTYGEFITAIESWYELSYNVKEERQAMKAFLSENIPDLKLFFGKVIAHHSKKWKTLPDLVIFREVAGSKSNPSILAELWWQKLLNRSNSIDVLITDPVAFFVVSGYGTWDRFCEQREGNYRELMHKDFISRYVSAMEAGIDVTPGVLPGYYGAEYGIRADRISIIGDETRGRELLTGAAPMMIENLMSFIQKVPEAGE